MSEQFDGWLERELSRKLSPMTPVSPMPAQARYRTTLLNRRSRMLRILPATAAAKAAAAIVAVAAAGTVTATAVTGSPNPQVWGQQVSQWVQSCKDSGAFSNGKHGIGDCVSDFASKHGQQERSTHAADQGQSGGSTNPGSSHPGGRP